MVLTNADERRRALWEEAFRSALGPLSAYITPDSYGLAAQSLAARQTSAADLFLAEVQARIEFAKARLIVESVSAEEVNAPISYRHAVHLSQGRIDGALHVPRLLQERARGRLDVLPVFRARAHEATPEALFISECLRMAAIVAKSWVGRGGAEGAEARRILSTVQRLQARSPWADLRSKPRPSINKLAALIQSRTIAGWNTPSSLFARMARLILDGAEAVSSISGDVAYLATTDSRFEDRLFELICLAWLLNALRHRADEVELFGSALKGSSGPILVGRTGSTEVKLYYQAGWISQSSRYLWKRSNRQLRAIPDFVLSVAHEGVERHFILDAKNRAASTASEIVYKLLGYRENLGWFRFWAFGLAPSFDRELLTARVRFEDRVAGVSFIPLDRGARFAHHLVRVLLAPGAALNVEKASMQATE